MSQAYQPNVDNTATPPATRVNGVMTKEEVIKFINELSDDDKELIFDKINIFHLHTVENIINKNFSTFDLLEFISDGSPYGASEIIEYVRDSMDRTVMRDSDVFGDKGKIADIQSVLGLNNLASVEMIIEEIKQLNNF